MNRLTGTTCASKTRQTDTLRGHYRMRVHREQVLTTIIPFLT